MVTRVRRYYIPGSYWPDGHSRVPTSPAQLKQKRFRRRSPGDVLGMMSLGCVMENMWLMAESLGIRFHILALS